MLQLQLLRLQLTRRGSCSYSLFCWGRLSHYLLAGEAARLVAAQQQAVQQLLQRQVEQKREQTTPRLQGLVAQVLHQRSAQ